MRCNRKAVFAILLFLGTLILLRQGIVVAKDQVPLIDRQVDMMQQKNIDPAALFYTDSRLALEAIRQTDEKVNH